MQFHLAMMVFAAMGFVPLDPELQQPTGPAPLRVDAVWQMNGIVMTHTWIEFRTVYKTVTMNGKNVTVSEQVAHQVAQKRLYTVPKLQVYDVAGKEIDSKQLPE